MKKELFSIILLHYNQEEYIYESIDSILKQDYSNIELIIADDGSKKLDTKKIEKYIEQNKNDNISNYIINVNDKNLGTVKTINKNIKICNGKYILFFAADDKLETPEVISNFIYGFKKYPNDNIITAQCIMYDKDLKEEYYKFISTKTKEIIKNSSAKKLYNLIARGCLFAAGATAYKKELLEKYNFDENYKLVEDWSFYLKITRLGENIRYVDFPALAHRDGGVSHNFSKTLSKTARQYYSDILNIYENEIIPYFNLLTFKTKMKVISDYKYYKNTFSTEDHIYKEKPLLYKICDYISIIKELSKEYIYNQYTFQNFFSSIYMLIIIITLLYLKIEFAGKVLFIIYFIPKLFMVVIDLIIKYARAIIIFNKRIKKKLKFGNAHYSEENEIRR